MTDEYFGYAMPKSILSHKEFTAARTAYIDAVLDLYEARPSLLEIMREWRPYLRLRDHHGTLGSLS